MDIKRKEIKENKNKLIKVRVTNSELERLKISSQNHQSLSAFILEACWYFNRKTDYDTLSYFEERCKIISKSSSAINYLGGNLNQLVHYTNHCIKMGIYQNNTADEIKRIQNEIFICLKDINNEFIKLKKEFKKSIKYI